MTLIIETGAGLSTAQAYADATAYAAWAALVYGETVTANSTTEAAILRAVRYLDGLAWNGYKTWGRTQALAWPRAYVQDVDGWPIVQTTIPAEVIEAQHLLTRAELATPGTLAPTVTLADQKTLTKVGSLEWTPAATPATVGAYRPTVTAAMDKLRGLIAASAQMVRA